ncbi:MULTISPECIES: MMPL family transporter [unclassified Brachybacterium]|uniref:MMPL family transporter n=1 Tax=unclassified Brachybacterium TaxID=2623841 RepID=UPI003606429E
MMTQGTDRSSPEDPSPSPADTRHTHRRAQSRTGYLLRLLLPSVLILLWLIAAGIGGPYFGRVDEVSSNDRTAYLPESAEATRVQQLSGDFTGTDAIPALIVITSPAELTPGQLETIRTATSSLADVDGVRGDVSPPIPSEDGLAVQVFVPIDAEADLASVVQRLDGRLAEDLPPGVTSHVTGPAGFSADLSGAFAGIDGLLLGVALLAVLVILVVVYRSLLLPVIVLATSMFALCTALLTVWWLAKAGLLLLSGQTQGILFILVIGAATDYSLLYVARFRDELRRRRRAGPATAAALRGTLEPILASGGTVIAGLLCLLLSDLKSNSALGPVAAIGIAFAMLAALTFLPAVLSLTGRVAFWPRRPRYAPEAQADAADADVEHPATDSGAWGRLARAVARRPRPIWILTTLVLVAGCAGALQLEADGVPQSDLILGPSPARDGQEALAEHFPAGQGSPVQVLAEEDQLQDAADVLLGTAGIDSVTVTADGVPSGSAPVTADGVRGQGAADGSAPEPTVVDTRVLLQATLTDAPDSAAAERTVREVRESFAEAGVDAVTGGVTATAIDTDDASARDRALIIPVVLVVILAILMLLLRSVLAPVLLVATTVLSFGTALGVSALVFTHVLEFPGADPAVPLFGFVFLVALGIDYNIFLMTRVREETLRHGTARGVVRGLAVTGGVITSAGLVLAATFAALGVIPILFLVQIAIIVALGVLLDTFVVRSLLVPALALDIGRTIWWPARLS